MGALRSSAWWDRFWPPGSNGTADLGRDLSSLARVVVGQARIAQRPQLAACDGLGQTEGVAAEHVDVGEAERGEACYIPIQHGEALGSQLCERGIHINRVPQHDHVDDKPECSELILLALAVALAQLPPAWRGTQRARGCGGPRGGW